MNIIQRRIARVFKLKDPYSERRRTERGKRKRISNDRNGVELYLPVSVRLSGPQISKLDSLCSKLNVERGPVMRDAIEFYLGMAEQEAWD